MEWKIITKEVVVDDKGTKVIVETPEQIDEVGNIYQKSGAVIPKACQNCKEDFKSEIKDFPITQDVPIYTCNDCDFEGVSGDSALSHIIEYPDHKLNKSIKERVIGIDKKAIGSVARIKKTEDDIIILCDKCLNG